MIRSYAPCDESSRLAGIEAVIVFAAIAAVERPAGSHPTPNRCAVRLMGGVRYELAGDEASRFLSDFSEFTKISAQHLDPWGGWLGGGG